MRLSRLYEELEDVYEEMNYLHYSSASLEQISERRSELQYKIMYLEQEIEYQKRLRPLRIATIVFIVGAIGIFLYFMY